MLCLSCAICIFNQDFQFLLKEELSTSGPWPCYSWSWWAAASTRWAIYSPVGHSPHHSLLSHSIPKGNKEAGLYCQFFLRIENQNLQEDTWLYYVLFIHWRSWKSWIFCTRLTSFISITLSASEIMTTALNRGRCLKGFRGRWCHNQIIPQFGHKKLHRIEKKEECSKTEQNRYVTAVLQLGLTGSKPG